MCGPHRAPGNLWINMGRSGTLRLYINPKTQSSRHEIGKAPDRSEAGAGGENRTHDLPLTKGLRYHYATPANRKARVEITRRGGGGGSYSRRGDGGKECPESAQRHDAKGWRQR